VFKPVVLTLTEVAYDVGISVNEVQEALLRLEELGFIRNTRIFCGVVKTEVYDHPVLTDFLLSKFLEQE